MNAGQFKLSNLYSICCIISNEITRKHQTLSGCGNYYGPADKATEVYVEKDYGLILALHHIFKGALAEYTIFKGGTALSKCFTYINMFSEDIYLLLIKEPVFHPIN
jgi:hypothetical protein